MHAGKDVLLTDSYQASRTDVKDASSLLKELKVTLRLELILTK